MNEMKVFENAEFGKIRTVEVDGEPWLVGKDVAQALGYSDSFGALKKHVDCDDKQNCQNDSFKTPRGMTIINESGLYSLVLCSKLPSAKKFKHWVTSEVLPSIRKHGAYMTSETIRDAILNPDTMIQLCTALKDEQQKNKALSEKIESDKPLVKFAQTVITSDGSIPISEFAKVMCGKGVNVGYRRLLKWLRENKYLMQSNFPYQRWVNQGVFEVADIVYESRVIPKAFITTKGQMYLCEKLRSEFSK